jgi:Domain of unknown function (DUF4157)
MSALALQSATDTLRSPRASPVPPLAVLAQRKSSLGGPGAVTAPPITDAGRPLDAGTRSSMESGFGQDFSGIRVHDDARAHDNARDMGARAYAAGDHIVFGEGHYRPETAMGQALIAHELAHSVQQGGVQMKADGPLPAAYDSELEGQADRAAIAVTAGRSAPALSKIGSAAVFRNGVGDPAVGGSATPTTQGATNIPKWVQGFENDTNKADLSPAYLGVKHGPVFKMPAEKGAGNSVKQAYQQGGIVSTIYVTGKKYSSFKEGLSSEGYQKQWLTKYGYSSFAAVSKAILASTDPEVIAVLDRPAGANSKNFPTNRKFVVALAGGIQKAGCAVDHIVEKHMGGASVPANLQLFDEKRNSASGSKSWAEVKQLVDDLKAPGMRGGKATQVQIFYTSVDVDAGPADPSFEVETLISTKVKGSDDVIKKGEGITVNLISGPNRAVSNIKDKGTSDVESGAERVVQGIKLKTYTRKKGKYDEAIGEFDHVAMRKLKPDDSVVKIMAEKIQTPAGDVASTADGAAVDATRETRKFEIAAGPKKIPFEYPNLSPGIVTSLDITDKGELIGGGVITPKIKFLGNIQFTFGPNMMKLSAAINPKSLKSPVPGFRFTGGSFDLQLAPELIPSSTVEFEIGPDKKPIIVGNVTAKPGEGGGFAVEGNIKTGPGIPGAEGASGKITYDWQKGWAGRLDISSNAIKNTTITAAVIMQQKGDKFDLQAEGGATVTVKDKVFDLKARWNDQLGTIEYLGSGKWEKPFKIVDSIQASIFYRNDYLKITGGGKFNFRQWKGDINLVYERFAGGGVKVAGDGKVEVETKDKKGIGSLEAHIDETGKIWGKGNLSYQITPTIRPEFNVELTKENLLHVSGSLTLGPYTLFERFPKDGKDSRELFKIGTPKFTIPTPILGVTVYARLTASVGYGFFIGPAVVQSIKISGSFDPLEENPNIVASLAGNFVCPFGATAYGKVGARIGAEVLGGLAGLEGGIDVTATVNVAPTIKAEAFGKYEKGNFTVGVKPSFDLNIDAKLDIDGAVTASAAWGLFSKTWDFNIASFKKNLYSKTVNFGEVSATFGSGKSLPGAQEKTALPDIEPIEMIKEIVNRRKNKDTPNPHYDPNAPVPSGRSREA